MDKIDFLPERIRQQRIRRRSMVRQGYLLTVTVAALVILGVLRQGQISQAKGELASLVDQAREVQRQLAYRGELEHQQADLMIKKRIDDQLGSRVNALEVLAELERLVPESIFLTNLNLEAVELKVPVKMAGGTANNDETRDKVVKRVRLVFTGIAPTDVDLANFIAQMSAGQIFEDVNMGYSKNVEFRDRIVREFQASCYVVR
jgi:Tfp pilus assembly protein PilN